MVNKTIFFFPSSYTISEGFRSSVTDSPCVPQDLAMQELQERAHQVAEEGRAQQAEEWAEDDNIVGRLVSATTPSEFR